MKVKEESEKAGLKLRDGMGREEGGGFRMGNTCIPVADYVKFKNKIKFKIFKKNKTKQKLNIQKTKIMTSGPITS